jgi:hypothetical protein
VIIPVVVVTDGVTVLVTTPVVEIPVGVVGIPLVVVGPTISEMYGIMTNELVYTNSLTILCVIY